MTDAKGSAARRPRASARAPRADWRSAGSAAPARDRRYARTRPMLQAPHVYAAPARAARPGVALHRATVARAPSARRRSGRRSPAPAIAWTPRAPRAAAPRLLRQDVRRDGFRFEPGRWRRPTARRSSTPSPRRARRPAGSSASSTGWSRSASGPTGTPGAIGLTEDGEPGYRVTIDLDLVLARYGPRGVERTVLHELGHVRRLTHC